MIERIIIAGAGGQGVMLLGKVLATAAMRDDRFTTCLPAYGAEVRGGAAHCSVVISDEIISSPYIDKADTLIAMNSLSFEKFQDRLAKGGIFILNSSLAQGDIKHNNIIKYPFTDLAIDLGNIKVANMVALGCYLAIKKIVKIDTLLQVISEMAPQNKPELIVINQKALLKGLGLTNGKS